MKKATAFCIAFILLFVAGGLVDNYPVAAIACVIAHMVIVQKAGIVNYLEEINKDY
ncbi:MAG: hypothetical protein MJZ26_08910 [Fibrobacter sp.]|nr:hypothetical protein [Fibrobacter sp.]